MFTVKNIDDGVNKPMTASPPLQPDEEKNLDLQIEGDILDASTGKLSLNPQFVQNVDDLGDRCDTIELDIQTVEQSVTTLSTDIETVKGDVGVVGLGPTVLQARTF